MSCYVNIVDKVSMGIFGSPYSETPPVATDSGGFINNTPPRVSTNILVVDTRRGTYGSITNNDNDNLCCERLLPPHSTTKPLLNQYNDYSAQRRLLHGPTNPGGNNTSCEFAKTYIIQIPSPLLEATISPTTSFTFSSSFCNTLFFSTK